MEEEVDIKKVQKMQSGSLFVLIKKESKQKLGLRKGMKVREKVDIVNHRLIYEPIR